MVLGKKRQQGGADRMEQSETNIQEEIMGEDTDPMVLPEEDEDTGGKEDRPLPAGAKK